MIVTITGAPGCGKSAIADELKQRGWRVVSAGAIMRREAAKRGIDIVSMQEEALRDDAIDKAIDAGTAEVEAADGENVLIDARMAWLFAKDPKLNVKVECPFFVAAKRVFLAKRCDEVFSSFSDTMSALFRRYAKEVERFRKLYGTSYDDDDVTFDLVFRTESMTPQKIADAIEEYVANLD